MFGGSRDSSPIDFVLESDSDDEDEEMEDIQDDDMEEEEEVIDEGYNLCGSGQSGCGPLHSIAEEAGFVPTLPGDGTGKAGKAIEEVVSVKAAARKPGKPPFSLPRVLKVVKVDQEIGSVSKDAVFLISLATEAFIARLAVESHRKAKMAKRTTVQRCDIVSVSNEQFRFWFLEGYSKPEVPGAMFMKWRRIAILPRTLLSAQTHQQPLALVCLGTQNSDMISPAGEVFKLRTHVKVQLAHCAALLGSAQSFGDGSLVRFNPPIAHKCNQALPSLSPGTFNRTVHLLLPEETFLALDPSPRVAAMLLLNLSSGGTARISVDSPQATTRSDSRHKRQVATVKALVRHLEGVERRLIRMKYFGERTIEGGSAELEGLLIVARAAIARMAEHVAAVFGR
ncbi:hypothetical protein FA13DRAFT_1713885 [Coprinellus micaceus]|uniref:Transcription factor CBF/NF-Y/archaeal histone domain-containing protein n=1 Tax=Coprinellus micaceus TaxID=71717 RepID=A0A4Y7SVJ6_COPMI|nr:hypothetical protein FA13DRAFT_1713885 [Coprinellus micaceus]